MSAPPAKRKRVVLSIDDKLKVVRELDAGSSLMMLASKYGVSKSTISDIKKQAASIRSYKEQTAEMGMKRSAKVI